MKSIVLLGCKEVWLCLVRIESVRVHNRTDHEDNKGIQSYRPLRPLWPKVFQIIYLSLLFIPVYCTRARNCCRESLRYIFWAFATRLSPIAHLQPC